MLKGRFEGWGGGEVTHPSVFMLSFSSCIIQPKRFLNSLPILLYPCARKLLEPLLWGDSSAISYWLDLLEAIHSTCLTSFLSIMFSSCTIPSLPPFIASATSYSYSPCYFFPLRFFFIYYGNLVLLEKLYSLKVQRLWLREQQYSHNGSAIVSVR